MNSPLTRQIATSGILIILSLIVVFHLLVMLGIIPFEIVWGGRLKDASQMLVFEAVSVVLNLLMLAVVGTHAGILKVKLNRMVIKTALWAMFLLFLLNTVGNLFSNNELEKMLFTPLTLLLSLFSLRLALSKEEKASF
ncbi:hypothetical protein [Cesiribacter sp. SM1]|uniref:hypothetical protein n=1 Tax=Cesiribacter sp. SM1 TaxID=2861196 RepID=UPI001CD63E94|nr:hypothetical protein [Cesiribacter sp. SM1]